LADFLEYWETQKDKISISSPSDPQAITVQTIHRSKGLEYPVVIIPYADWEFVPSAKRDSMWVTLESTADLRVGSFDFKSFEAGETMEQEEIKFMQTGSVKVTKALEKTTESIARQYREECEKVFVENLNLLYVAFTRPTKKLYVLARVEKDFSKIENPRRVSYWLHQYLERNQGIGDSRQETAGKNRLSEVSHPPFSLLPSPFYIPHVISTDRSRELRLRRLANRVFDVETFERKKDHGNKVHFALSMVKTPNDVPVALLKMQTEGVIEKNEADEIQKSLERILQNSDLAGLFDSESSVLNEREILTPDGNLHRPDRVVHLPDRVVVLDYKTGIPLEIHVRQIKRYANLYKEMGYEKVEALLVYIERNEVVKV
jgi:ATP-dependent exoDNAse (exonuclease V) beta subunit